MNPVSHSTNGARLLAVALRIALLGGALLLSARTGYA